MDILDRFLSPRQQDGRRRFLRRTGFGVLGWSAAELALLERQVRAAGVARKVLVLFEQGGVSHIDTWDPKPDAPTEHRSPFKTMSTPVDGLQVTELLKQSSAVTRHLTVVRCMTQPTPGIGNSHPKGSQYVLSGEAPGGPIEMPDIGSVVASLQGSDAPHLPGHVMLPGNSEQAGVSTPGFLSAAYTAFRTGGSPADPKWTVPNLGLVGGIGAERFTERRKLLASLDTGLLPARGGKPVKALGSLMDQASDMLTNPLTRKAFDLSSESSKVRERYGLGHRGQCYLLARKLIESGVRFVTVDPREPLNSHRDGKPVRYDGGGNMNWDHHDAIYSTSHTNIKGGGAGAGRWGIGTWPMMGSLDQAFSALIADMSDRGLLKDTLVCLVTEFGRTPKVNERQGRDHWTPAFTFVFAGAGVPGGQVVGATDKDGGYITSSAAYTIDDYAATVYEKLGIDRSKPLHTPVNRPIYLAAHGRPIPELF